MWCASVDSPLNAISSNSWLENEILVFQFATQWNFEHINVKPEVYSIHCFVIFCVASYMKYSNQAVFFFWKTYILIFSISMLTVQLCWTKIKTTHSFMRKCWRGKKCLTKVLIQLHYSDITLALHWYLIKWKCSLRAETMKNLITRGQIYTHVKKCYTGFAFIN